MASRDASGYSKEDMDLILGSQKVKQLAEESSDSEVAYESDQDDVNIFPNLFCTFKKLNYLSRDLF